MDKLMDETIEKIMDNCNTTVMAVVDKKDCLHTGMCGDFNYIIVCIGRIIVDLAKQSGMSLETIGDELNKAVDNIRQVDKDG
jgi:hypothetical protein